MTLKEVLDRTVKFFKEKNLDSPRLDAELLIARAFNFRRIDLYLKFDQPVGDAELGICREFVRRRSGGEPVAYILGEKDFYGLSFQVDSRVLIPRPETELLAEAAIEFLKNKKDEPLKILDLGCGSGCLGLVLAEKFPQSEVTLVDLSPEALTVARANAERVGVFSRCHWVSADAAKLDLPSGTFDLIVANPPYIAKDDLRVQPEVAKFEPSLALYSEDQGLASMRSWSQNAFRLLQSGGWIGFEFGIDQDKQAQEHFQNLGFQNVRIIKDLSGLARHVTAVKGPSHG